MELALYCPDCGYYEKEDDNLGRRGDFYTSVSVGSLFGELLAFQFADWLATLPNERLQLVEAGAHNGRLAVDILHWLQQRRPEIFDRVEYVLCEPSETRRGWQRKTSVDYSSRVRWVEADLAQMAGQFTGVIFSNELLDAMPAHRVGWNKQRREWFEWGVVIAGNGFGWARMDLSRSGNSEASIAHRFARLPAELLEVLPDDFTTEVNPAAEEWWQAAACALRHGWLMTLDYGLMAEEFLTPHRAAGTLRGYRSHRLCEDLLAVPGDQDLTGHVNFSVVQQAGEAAGLRTEALSSQADFFASIMKRYWSEAEREGCWTSHRSRELQTLIHPEHLGRAFQVLVQNRRAGVYSAGSEMGLRMGK